MEPKQKAKIRKVTVSVEFIRKAIIMRNRQKIFFETKNPAYIRPAKTAEAIFDAELSLIVKELRDMASKVESALQEGLI